MCTIRHRRASSESPSKASVGSGAEMWAHEHCTILALLFSFSARQKRSKLVKLIQGSCKHHAKDVHVEKKGTNAS